MPPEEKKQLYQRLSETEYHSRLLPEEQKNHMLSEARSELNLQELRVESADRALHESDSTVNAWNSTRRIIYLTIAGERMIGCLQNWRKEKKLFKNIA